MSTWWKEYKTTVIRAVRFILGVLLTSLGRALTAPSPT